VVLAPPNKAPSPPNLERKHYISVEFFFSFQKSGPTCTNVKPPIDGFLATVLPMYLSCCSLWIRYGVKTRLACTVAKAADIQWRKMLTVGNTARVELGCFFDFNCFVAILDHSFYRSMRRKLF